MSKSLTSSTMTSEEYLEFEANSDVRHEYVDGQVFTMSGATEAHNVICGNLFTRLHSHVRGSGCRAFINDMKVHVKAANSFYYPDIMVTCEVFEAKSVFKASPVLIVEVLSPSTRQIDCREKLVSYRKLDSLREYVLVRQNKMLVEVYCKGAGGKWQVNQFRKSDQLELESLPGGPLTIDVSEIYAEVEPLSLVEEEEGEYQFADG
jgi:Uma2 family endonuclease